MFALVALALSAHAGERMPVTRLAPGQLQPGICLYHYPVASPSAKCQAHCDLGAGFYQNYVYLEAARHYETAIQADPGCALAWLGLATSLEKWSPPKPNATPLLAVAGGAVTARLPGRFGPAKDYALAEAKRRMDSAGTRGQLLIRAKLQEKGKWDDSPKTESRVKAVATLDELLTLHDDDQEAWYARAALAEGQYGKAPFYKALLRVNPLHPGANHELVHFYEQIRRPALGWPYAQAYMKSSPGIPHAFHMQAHLAMRTGKWQNTTDWSAKAIALEDGYHTSAGVKPRADQQYRHHLDVLTKSLVHDGRFAELETTRGKAESIGAEFRQDWFRAAIAREDWGAANKLVADARKADKGLGAYLGAILALERGDLPRAEAEAKSLSGSKGKGKVTELRNLEVSGRLAAAKGRGQAGVDSLKKAVAKTQNDYSHDAWGGGGYFYEVWGLTALGAGLDAEAEEGLLEALAHDHGSVHAALGLEALCQRQGRAAEASAYRKLADRAWGRADPADLARLRMRVVARSESALESGRKKLITEDTENTEKAKP